MFNYINYDGENFEIGKTGMLQFQDTHITSIKFSQNEDEKTLVECILEQGIERFPIFFILLSSSAIILTLKSKQFPKCKNINPFT